MLRNTFRGQNISFRDKVLAFDYVLVLLVLLLGIISVFAMYSSERGAFSYHTENHIYRFIAFFLLFLAISFIKVKTWFRLTYFFYILVLILLFCVDFFEGRLSLISLFVVNRDSRKLSELHATVDHNCTWRSSENMKRTNGECRKLLIKRTL